MLMLHYVNNISNSKLNIASSEKQFELGKLEFFLKSLRTVRFANCSDTPLSPVPSPRQSPFEKALSGASFSSSSSSLGFSFLLSS
jgi:hypothetical protein